MDRPLRFDSRYGRKPVATLPKYGTSTVPVEGRAQGACPAPVAGWRNGIRSALKMHRPTDMGVRISPRLPVDTDKKSRDAFEASRDFLFYGRFIDRFCRTKTRKDTSRPEGIERRALPASRRRESTKRARRKTAHNRQPGWGRSSPAGSDHERTTVVANVAAGEIIPKTQESKPIYEGSGDPVVQGKPIPYIVRQIEKRYR